MRERNDLINKMLEMQKKFIAHEQKNGISGKDYFCAPEGSLLNTYNEEYMKMVDKLVDVAHKDKGSIRT